MSPIVGFYHTAKVSNDKILMSNLGQKSAQF